MGLKKGDKLTFSTKLLHWNKKVNKRQMPWKGEKDPYKVWLSEVILQQTRVEQGWAYYERFIQRYPNIRDLAAASEDEVFKLWEGLGYYSRCRNLLHTARFIAFDRSGVFPSNYKDLSGLKGVGPYTAAAVASFAFGLPHAVVDGNVIRVLSRVFGISKPVDESSTKKEITALADQLLDKNNPADYNQALMDFGASICKPKAPLCHSCPLAVECVAFQSKQVDRLPVKGKKLIRKKRYFHYLIFEYNGLVYVKKRAGKDIWKDLFEFFLLEADCLIDPSDLVKQPYFRKIAGKGFEILHVSAVHKQQLTHQQLTGMFIHVKLKAPPGGLEDHQAVSKKSLSRLAFPKLILSYLLEKN
jgi:A/G-specific adenine glycosylase